MINSFKNNIQLLETVYLNNVLSEKKELFLFKNRCSRDSLSLFTRAVWHKRDKRKLFNLLGTFEQD